jgi:hypothetical protein
MLLSAYATALLVFCMYIIVSKLRLVDKRSTAEMFRLRVADNAGPGQLPVTRMITYDSALGPRKKIVRGRDSADTCFLGCCKCNVVRSLPFKDDMQ